MPGIFDTWMSQKDWGTCAATITSSLFIAPKLIPQMSILKHSTIPALHWLLVLANHFRLLVGLSSIWTPLCTLVIIYSPNWCGHTFTSAVVGPFIGRSFLTTTFTRFFTSLETSRSVVPIIVIVRHLDRGRHNPTVLLVWWNVTFFLFYDCINFSYPHTLLSQIVLVLLRIFLSSFG